MVLAVIRTYDEPVERIFHIKDRSEDKPLPIMGSNISDIEKLVHMSSLAKSLAQHFWPGALTIVSPCKDNNISRRVMAGGDNLAVRIPGRYMHTDITQVLQVPDRN